jgi:aspartyl-tRNA(Asn)/glutamyl-tRNA(Gln) amidotransferase subunit C
MLTAQSIDKIAKLAKLNFTEEECGRFVSDLSDIMTMIDILKQVDCSTIDPLTSVCEMNQRMRVDLVTEPNLVDDLFSNVLGTTSSLAKEIKCFIVPKVIE